MHNGSLEQVKNGYFPLEDEAFASSFPVLIFVKSPNLTFILSPTNPNLVTRILLISCRVSTAVKVLRAERNNSTQCDIPIAIKSIYRFQDFHFRFIYCRRNIVNICIRVGANKVIYTLLHFSIPSSSSIAASISRSSFRSSAKISLVGGYSTGLYSVFLYLLMDRS